MPAPSRIDRLFTSCRSERPRRAALMPFVTAGHPSPMDTERLLPALAAAGADVIEIGIPFSDPIADGPVIAEAMHSALARGVTPSAVFEQVGRVREKVTAALVAMVSISIVDRMGATAFADAAARAGLDGLIVPDLDLDDAAPLAAACAARGLSFTLLVAPTSPMARVRRIIALCTGFVYVLARLGVTGERADLSGDLVSRLAALREVTPLPLAVGFGVSDAAQVRAIGEVADGVIVGSALVRRLDRAAAAGADVAAAGGSFLRELAGGVSR